MRIRVEEQVLMQKNIYRTVAAPLQHLPAPLIPELSASGPRHCQPETTDHLEQRYNAVDQNPLTNAGPKYRSGQY